MSDNIIKNNMKKNILYEDLKSAMKTKDISKKLSKIRLIKKYIRELETSVGHSEASDSDYDFATDDEIEMFKIIQKLVKQGKDAASKYEADRRLNLPKQQMMSDDEISIEIDRVMLETGSTNMEELTEELNLRLAGRADDKTISRILKTKL